MNGAGIPPAARAIGVILPSSNRIVERVTRDILSLIPDIDACFARIPYFGDGEGQPPGRYDEQPFLAAAELLTHARVDALCWNATRGAMLGFAPDRALSAHITQHTGLPVATTALAALDVFQSFRISRIALVTHGAAEQGEMVKQRFQEQGIETGAALHLGFTDNFAAALVEPERIVGFAKACATKGGVDAILIWSTNLPGHAFAAALEEEIGMPVLDSAAIGIWAALRALGVDTRPAASRGLLFRQGQG
jgi:maleate isomerase